MTQSPIGLSASRTKSKWAQSSPSDLDKELYSSTNAFGSHSIRVVDPRALLEELISTDGLFQVDEVSDQIRNMITPKPKANTPEVAANTTPLQKLTSPLTTMGIPSPKPVKSNTRAGIRHLVTSPDSSTTS